MTDRARLTIAALVTALFLGAISAAGALTHSHATLATNHEPRSAGRALGAAGDAVRHDDQ